jgi:hypothetical protein
MGDRKPIAHFRVQPGWQHYCAYCDYAHYAYVDGTAAPARRQPGAVHAQAMALPANPELMTDERRFEELLAEFERVGVDLHSFPAGITVRREEAMRILHSLPDRAGPAAFLARIREEQQSRTPPHGTERQTLEARD